jgi:hypothetical protein
MAITLRNVKGTELSHAEMDTNFESFYYSSSLSSNTLTLHTTGSDTHSIDLSPILPATPTLQQVTTQGATTTNDIEVSGSLDVTGSFNAIGQSTFTSLNSLSSPLVIEPGLGSSYGSVYMKTSATAGTIAEFNQTAISINSSYTLGSLKFSKQTSTWGLIKVQATNTDQKSVISLTANSTSTPHIEIDGENDEITLKNKILAPDLANTSKPYVVGFDSASGELTYFTTGSFGSGGGGSVDTGSFYVSSSINTAGNVITFNQGDGTTESVTVDTTNYTARYDITNKATSGPGTSRPSHFIAGGSVIASGGTAKTIRISEIADKDLGDDVFITATYVGGDTDVPITVQASGATADIPRTINSSGEIDFKAGGSTLASDTYFMYHIIYTD